MLNLREEIEAIENSQLSSPVGTELLSTVEAAGTLRATLQTTSFPNLAYDAFRWTS